MNWLLAVRDWLVRRYVTWCREAFNWPDDDPLDYPESGGWGP